MLLRMAMLVAVMGLWTGTVGAQWKSLDEIREERAARDAIAAQNGLATERNQFDAWVEKDIKQRPTKRSIIVRLSRPISEDMLTEIAHQLRGQDLGFDRTFIEYYLPGMVDGCGAWATTHFTPRLDVQTVGITLDNQRQMGCIE